MEGGWENKDTWRPDKDISLKQSKEPALVLCFNYCLFILCTIKGGGVVRFYLPIKIYLPYRYWLHLHSAIIMHTYTSMFWRYSIIYNTIKRNTVSVNFLKAILTHYNIKKWNSLQHDVKNNMEKSNMKIKLIPKYTQWQGPVNLLDYVVNLSRETLIVSFYNLNYPFPKEFRYWKKNPQFLA